MKPFTQKKLYGLDKYFFELKNLYDNEKMPNKILLSGKKGSGKSTLAYHVINYVLSKLEVDKYDLEKLIINKNNKSFKLLTNKTHSNFHLIDIIDEIVSKCIFVSKLGMQISIDFLGFLFTTYYTTFF